MTRFPHDQFAKQYLQSLLTPLGHVEVSKEVPGEARQIDLFFHPSLTPETNPQELGLLGDLAATPCLFEPYRNPPTPTDVRNCLLKLFLVHANLQRQANRDDDPLPEADLPRLWILSPSASESWLTQLATTPAPEPWTSGVYFLAPVLRAGVVVINQLPVTHQTLWLRLLGKGQVQKQAIEEVLGLPSSEARRGDILRLLASWKITLEGSGVVDAEEGELMVTLSQAYQAYVELEERTRQEALQQGMQTERRATVENILRSRFGELDDRLLTIIEPLLSLSAQDYAQQLPLLFTLSRETLLDRFEA